MFNGKFLICLIVPFSSWLLPSISIATPIEYEATYAVTSLTGTREPSDGWGSIATGDTAYLSFTWDWDNALGAPTSLRDHTAGNIFDWTLRLDDGTLTGSFGNSSNSLMWRDPWSDSIRLVDEVPNCTVSGGGDCGGFIESVIFPMTCGGWADRSHYMQNLDCETNISGQLYFSVWTDYYAGDGWSLQASLSDIHQVSEAGSLSLFSVAMAVLLTVLVRNNNVNNKKRTLLR